MNFYVLECIISKDANSIVIETVGIYSSEDSAKHYRDMCTQDLSEKEKEWMIFEYRPVAVDEEPEFLKLHSMGVSIRDEVDKILIDLVKKGLLEQLIGEDGKFYFEFNRQRQKTIGLSETIMTNRRKFLKGLATSLFLPASASAFESGSSDKSLIIVFLKGGPSTIDMFDMKPNAPTEYRGEFKPNFNMRTRYTYFRASTSAGTTTG